MVSFRKNALRNLLKSSGLAVFSLAVLVGLTLASAASAQIYAPTLGDGPGDCPAQYHSCGGGGITPYFAPDPFDLGEACDNNFLAWDSSTNAPSDSSCYGKCNLNNPTADCYVGCQDGYSSCLRSAFPLPPRQVPLGSQNPRNTPNISGNIYRSCLADRIPTLYATEFQQCRNDGGSPEACCAQIAAHYP
jgi:hypothetical protein